MSAWSARSGRLSSDRLRGLADIAERFGSGTLRLTVWQNLLISDIPDAQLDDALARSRRSAWTGAPARSRGGLVACTGNAGCKFSASDTKRHAAMLADLLERRITIDQPINIHLTGCHHSCAQHYVADIGLLATKVEQGEDMVEGYDLLVGGGAGAEQKLGRLVRAKVVFDDAAADACWPCWRAWQHERAAPDETFQAFTARPVGRRSAGAVDARRCPRWRCMNAIVAADPADPGERAVLAGAAGLAEWLPRRAVRRRARRRPVSRHASRRPPEPGRLPLARSGPGTATSG